MNPKNRILQVIAAVLVGAVCAAIVLFRERHQAVAEQGAQRATVDAKTKKEAATEPIPATTDPLSDAAPTTGTRSTTAADAINQLARSVVTIGQADSSSGQADLNFHRQTGVVVDPQGYIVTLWLEDKYVDDDRKMFTVHFLDHRDSDYAADMVENDQYWHLALLKVRAKERFPAISLDRIQEAEFQGTAFVIPSPRQKQPLKGRITTTSSNWGNSYPYTFVGSNIRLPAGEAGSLLVSGRGEPIGIMSNKIVENQVSYAVPLDEVKRFVKSAMNPDDAGALQEPGRAPVRRRPALSDDELMDSLRVREPEPGKPRLAEADDLDPGASHSPRGSAPATFTGVPAAAGRRSRSMTDSPAEQKLFEQLQARETAAAELAEKLRRLRLEGAVERNQAAMDDSQRELTRQLGQAFDLKLQLEELQVQELQSRLSQLERQIGQRRGLRDKIIARRATQLVDGEDKGLQWDSPGPSPQPPPRSVSSGRQTPTPASSPAAVKKLQRRAELLLDGMQWGEVKPAAVLSALQELKRIEPPPDDEWLQLLQLLLEETRKLHRGGQITQADRLQIEAAFEEAAAANASPGLPPKTGNTAPAKAGRDPTKPGCTQVCLSGPKDMHFSIAGEEDLDTNGTYFSIKRQAGQVRRVPVLVRFASDGQVSLRGRLDVYPTDSNDPEADQFLQNKALLFRISEKDTRTVAGGVDVTKVVVMSFGMSLSDKELEKIDLQTIDSSNFPPGTDIIEVASRNGTIVAVLSLSQRFLPKESEEGADSPKPIDGDSDTPTRVPVNEKGDPER